MKGFYCIYCLHLFAFTIVNSQFNSSNLPIVIIETNGQEIKDEPRIVAEMKTINNRNGERNYIASEVYEYNGKITIEIRGTTSQSFPKKQYGLETQYESGENRNTQLLGLPSENDWILNGPYSDKSLIRNILAYQIARGMGQYATRTVLCELVLNGEYMGVYVLIEKIKRDRNRIDITELDVDDISGDEVTGGYIFKIDRDNTDACSRWQTEYAHVYMQLHYPDCEDLIPEQLDYGRNFINSFEGVLFSDSYTDPTSGYRAYIDFNSFLDYFFANEIAKNVDAYRLSTFMYKDRDSEGGKLVMGPVWDFNIAFGNVDYANGFRTDSLRAPLYPWWSKMLNDSIFYAEAAIRWDYHRKNSISTDKLLGIIDSLTTLLDEAQERNFERWNILGKEIWPNYFVGSTYHSEIEYLKSWLVNRINWLDNYFNRPSNPEQIDDMYITDFYPNPFTCFYTIEFNLSEAGDVKFIFYNLMGEIVMESKSQFYENGYHKITYYIGPEDVFRASCGLLLLIMEKDKQPVEFLKAVRINY